jgi:hypothetical protein
MGLVIYGGSGLLLMPLFSIKNLHFAFARGLLFPHQNSKNGITIEAALLLYFNQGRERPKISRPKRFYRR